jgi:hypothetical protein
MRDKKRRSFADGEKSASLLNIPLYYRAFYINCRQAFIALFDIETDTLAPHLMS